MTQEQFIELANRGKNIFLTGYPGTGKSFIINKWYEDNKRTKKIVKLAPTGIAAINIGGSTIHKALRLYGDNYNIIKKQTINWNVIDTLIIDEISMVSVELFNYISHVICKHTKEYIPFGGIQVICVGDLKQLPPIYDLSNDETFTKYKQLIARYGGVEFLLSEAYKEGNFEMISLTEVKRVDKSDKLLIPLLHRIRDGDLSALNEFKSEGYSKQFYNTATHIFPYNYKVDNYNRERLLKLSGKMRKYKGEIKGEFNSNNVLSPLELELKIGARVMITKNLECGLVNGDIGEILDMNDKFVEFKSDRLQKEFIIGYETWRNLSYDEDGDEIELGSFKQLPLRLSYALTNYKVQGLTLDKIIIHYNSKLSNEALYVALSRGKNYDNIYVIYD